MERKPKKRIQMPFELGKKKNEGENAGVKEKKVRVFLVNFLDPFPERSEEKRNENHCAVKEDVEIIG